MTWSAVAAATAFNRGSRSCRVSRRSVAAATVPKAAAAAAALQTTYSLLMTTRPPAVAGSFYEGTPERLRAQVEACFSVNPPPPAEKRRFIGAVVPHAGLVYSGHVAAAFYAI